MNLALEENLYNPIDTIEGIFARDKVSYDRRKETELVAEVQGKWDNMLVFFAYEEYMRCLHISCLLNLEASAVDRGKMFELLAMQGYYNIYVGITSPNERSMKFHKAMGFIISGAYQESMYKFGQWRDVLWMGKSLRPHDGAPQPTVPFPEIKDSPLVTRALNQAVEKIHF